MGWLKSYLSPRPKELMRGCSGTRQRSWVARRDKLLREESLNPEAWWWLSFAGQDGFRGGVLTRSRGPVHAIIKTHLLGINPGGDVRTLGPFLDIPEEHKHYTDVLLSKHDMETKLGGFQHFDH